MKLQHHCENCEFWECDYESIDVAMSDQACCQNEALDYMCFGTCRRMPPIFNNASDDRAAKHFRIFGNRSDFFSQPTTYCSDWCGEFKPVK